MSGEPVPDNTGVDLRTRITDMVSLTDEAFAVMEELKQAICAILASKRNTSRKITKKATICQKSLSNIAKVRHVAAMASQSLIDYTLRSTEMYPVARDFNVFMFAVNLMV